MFWAQMAQFRGVLSDCLPRPCLRINTSHHAAAFIWWEDKLRRDAKKRSSRPLNTDASAVAKKEASHIDSGVKTKDTSRSGHKLGKILILFHPKPMTSYINLQHTAAGKGCLQCKVSGQWAFNLSKCLDQQPGGNPVLCRVQLNTWTESTTAEVSSIWSLNQLLGHHEKPSVCTSGRPQLWRSQALIWLPPGQDMQRRAWEIKKCALPASRVATAWQMPVGSCSLAQSCKALLLITFNFHMIGNFKRTRHVTDCPLSVAKFGPDRPDPQIQSRARSTHQSWRPRNWRWSFQRLSDLPHCSGDSVSTLLGCAVPKPWLRQLQGLKNIQHNPSRFPSHGGSTNDFNGKIQKQIISSARYESE